MKLCYWPDLVAPYGHNEQAKEDGLKDEDDGMEDPGLLGKHCLPRHPDGVRSLTPSSSSLHFAFQAVQTFHVPRDHNQYHRVDGKNPDVKKELEKVLLVPLTHAVIDPRTMVVHSPNAPLAYSAVMGPAKSKRKLLHLIWNFQLRMIFWV